MNMKKILLTLIIGIFLFSFASASIQEIDPVKQGSCISVIKSGNFSSCNIQVLFPDGSLSEVLDMQKEGLRFNYSFCETAEYGSYLVDGICDESSWQIQFKSTVNGLSQSTGQALVTGAYMLFMLLLTGVFGFMGFKYVENDYLWVLGIFFLFMALLFVVYNVWLSYDFHSNWIGVSGGSSVPEYFFWSFLCLLSAGLLVSGILLFTKYPELKKFLKKASSPDKEWEDKEVFGY